MMPGMNGLDVLRSLRQRGISTPVLLLTARGELDDKITGLDAGADDYLPKPFAMGELLARIRAMTRRRDSFTPDRLSYGDLTLDRGGFELCCGESRVRLGNREFQMIELLMEGAGRVIPTETFMERIWGYDTEAEISVVWVYISYLRKKLASLGSGCEIRATRGVGYSLDTGRHHDTATADKIHTHLHADFLHRAFPARRRAEYRQLHLGRAPHKRHARAAGEKPGRDS